MEDARFVQALNGTSCMTATTPRKLDSNYAYGSPSIAKLNPVARFNLLTPRIGQLRYFGVRSESKSAVSGALSR